MRKNSKTSKGDKSENASALIDPAMLVQTKTNVPPGSALSPSSPESEGQSSSLPGLAGTSSTTYSFLSEEQIPPPSPFDQPSTSKDFPVKV